MNKLNNKKLNIMICGLRTLTILILGAMIMPLEANADRAGHITPYNSTRFNNVSSNNQYNTNNQYNDNANGANYVTSYNSTRFNSVAPTVYSGSPSVNTTTAETTPATAKETTPTVTTKSTEDSNGLVAGAIFGENSFLPSGLIQWILLAIFILLVVILIRRATGARDKYHNTPLKHA